MHSKPFFSHIKVGYICVNSYFILCYMQLYMLYHNCDNTVDEDYHDVSSFLLIFSTSTSFFLAEKAFHLSINED